MDLDPSTAVVLDHQPPSEEQDCSGRYASKTTEQSRVGEVTDSKPPTNGQTWFRWLYVVLSTALLLLNYFLAQYDKYVLSYFQGDLESSLGLSASQYSVLSGYATGVSYALMVIFIACLADSLPAARVWILAIASAWSSLCMIFQSLSHNFWQILLARIGMGLGQSCMEPISISLLSDVIGGWRNSFVVGSILYVGVFLGECVSGQVATVYTEPGAWRIATRAAGIAGIITALLLRVVIREADRVPGILADRIRLEFGDSQHGPPGFGHLTSDEKFRRSKAGTTISYLLRLRAWWVLLLAASVRQLGANVYGFYMPTYLKTVFFDEPRILSYYGIVVGTVGTASVIAGGIVTSLLWNRTKATPIWLAAIGGIVSGISVLFMVFSREINHGDKQAGLQTLYGVMALSYVSGEIWFGTMTVFIASLLPREHKTIGLAIWAAIHVLIYSSGPEILGLALEGTDTGTSTYQTLLKIVLAAVIPGSYGLASVGFFAALPLLRIDMKRGVDLSEPLSRRRKIMLSVSGIVVLALIVTLFILSITSVAT